MTVICQSFDRQLSPSIEYYRVRHKIKLRKYKFELKVNALVSKKKPFEKTNI